MKKKEIACIIVFAVLSIGYRFLMPSETVESVETKQEITVHIQGAREEILVFTSPPTIAEVFAMLEVDNQYGFDMTYSLFDKQVLYIPVGEEQSLLSLNSATHEELQTVPGIGPVTANRIIEYRSSTPFQCIEDIMNISGIGEKTYYNIREYLCL